MSANEFVLGLLALSVAVSAWLWMLLLDEIWSHKLTQKHKDELSLDFKNSVNSWTVRGFQSPITKADQ